MPKPYSYDLRQKVIQAIELDGMKKSEATAFDCESDAYGGHWLVLSLSWA